MDQITYYIIAIFLSCLSILGTLLAWVMGFAKVVLPQKEAIKNLQKEVKELKDEKKTDQKVISKLLIDNAKLITEMKHLTDSVENLTNKFDNMMISLNKFIQP